MIREPVQPRGGALATALEAMCEAESQPWGLDGVEEGPIASDQKPRWGRAWGYAWPQRRQDNEIRLLKGGVMW